MAHSAEQPISAFLDNVHLARAQAGKSLTLWPLVRNDVIEQPAGPEYVSFRTALARGTLRIDDVEDSSAVPRVSVSVSGSAATLFLLGEKIRGPKQNRIAKASFLVPANSEAVLEVTCAEASRCEHLRGACFEANDEVVSLNLHRKPSTRFRDARSRGIRFAAQSPEEWIRDDRRPDQTAANPAAGSYADYCNRRRSEVETLCEAFHPIARQVGFVVCRGGRIVGAEAIGRPEVFRSDFKAMLRAYAIDAVDAVDAEPETLRDPRVNGVDGPHFEAPEDFLEELAAAPVTRGSCRGVGDDYRIESDLVTGGALANAGLVHLTAYPTPSRLRIVRFAAGAPALSREALRVSSP